eukprot:g314.t1
MVSRVGGMSEEETAQCAKDVAAFFVDKGGMELAGGASDESLQRLSKAAGECPALEAMLRVADGGIWYNECQALTAEQIVEKAGEAEGCVPFAADLDGNLLVVADGGEGAVTEWDADDGAGDTLASSFADFLEEYSKKLLSGRWEFVDECGVMEKMGGGGGEGKE